MASEKHAPGYVPNPYYSQEDWDEVCNNPELTDQQLAEGQPLRTAMPEFVEAMRRQRGKQKTPTKVLLSLRIDQDVVEAYRAGGPGWQSRINETLRKSLGL